MKKNICFLLSFLLLISFVPIAYADSGIVECPNTKIIFNGELQKISDVTIAVNGSTMLPLRALLVSLGVPNDNQHIIWDGTNKKITVNMDSNKIIMQVGNKTAYVNGNPITLDVSPIGYSKNGRTYIPVRFVAQALGYKVLWDQYLKCVYITTDSNYNKIKDIIEKSKNKMDSYKKIFLYNESSTNWSGGLMISDTILKIDRNNQNIHSLMVVTDNGDQIAGMEYYITNKYNYFESFYTDGVWKRQQIIGPYFNNTMNLNLFLKNDILYSSLAEIDSSNDNQIILKGYSYPYDETYMNKGKDIVQFVSFEICLNKTDYSIVKISANLKRTSDGYTERTDTWTFKGFDQDVEDVIIPNELLTCEWR